jgi:hypothetical protein
VSPGQSQHRPSNLFASFLSLFKQRGERFEIRRELEMPHGRLTRHVGGLVVLKKERRRKGKKEKKG